MFERKTKHRRCDLSHTEDKSKDEVLRPDLIQTKFSDYWQLSNLQKSSYS